MLCSGAIGVLRRGRKLSDSGAKARFFHEVSDAHLSRIIKVDLQSDVFTYALDTQALQRAALMDGKLMLVTNVADLSATEVVQRYKALADRFESALALGDVWALDQLWRELGFDALAAVFRRARYTTPIEQAIRVMVFNRLCDADSKLGTLRWLQTVSMPGVDADNLSHQQLLRSMDALMDHQVAVNDTVAHLLRPLIDEELSVVFYDLTTIRAEGLSEHGGDVRRFGMSDRKSVV